MQNLIRFFRIYNVLIIFLLLQTYSISLYINNNSFQNSLFINHVNNYKGELYSISNNISEYFNLKDINKQLLEENNKLYNLLSSQKSIFLQNEKETKFIEYENEEEFLKDGSFTYSEDNKLKGMIIMFSYDGRPHYEYAPLYITNEEYLVWEKDILEKNIMGDWIQNIFCSPTGHHWFVCSIDNQLHFVLF